MIDSLKQGTELKNEEHHNFYKIENVLGSGGFGITYKAVKIERTAFETKEIPVAIKEFFITDKCSRNNNTVSIRSITIEQYNQFKTKFISEAQILAKFKNQPNIVNVIDYFEANNTAYLVMEFIDGKSLKEIITEKGRLSQQESIKLIIQTAEGLRTIHDQDYFHRDIKPGNIMIDKNGVAKLIDFGTAIEILDEETKTNTGILTKGFAPPEQYNHKYKPAPSLDIYSLGATFYQTVTGRIPEDATQRKDFNNPEKDFLKSPTEIIQNLDKGINDIILKSMEMASSKRYQTIDEILFALANLKLSDEKTIIINKEISESNLSKSNSETEKIERESIIDNNATQIIELPKTPQNKPIHKEPQIPNQPQKIDENLCTASFILAIVGILLCFIPYVGIIGILSAITSIVLGRIGYLKTKWGNKAKSLAIVGLITSFLAVCLGTYFQIQPFKELNFQNSSDKILDQQINPNTFIDSRDGKTYKTVKIGSQTWMAENLNYETSTGSWCYADNSANCDIYGRLYDWETAKKSCPKGWHLPSDVEWTQLINYLGGESVAGGKMKEAGTTHWNSPNKDADNSSGFTALPGGYRYIDGTFNGYGSYFGYFWSASEYVGTDIWRRSLNYNYANVSRYDGNKACGFSVRCIKDNGNNQNQAEQKKALDDSLKARKELDSINAVIIQQEKGKQNNPNTFTDPRDGRTYKTVRIGNQIWMAENLNYLSTGSWRSEYNTSNSNIYGRLYNWEAAKSACPKGWHLPSDEEWTQLTVYLGGENVAGSKMKEAGTTHWFSPNSDANNSSGFSALPGGGRSDFGSLGVVGRDGRWWSATKYSNWGAYCRELSYGNTYIDRSYENQNCGFSVRCIKDNESSQNQVSSEKDSRDSKTYKIVKIGKQTWMAENLNYHTSSGSWCYNNNRSNCDKYGRLYDWETAKKACPDGWHLPSNGEWSQLINYLGGETVAGDKMKEAGTTNWHSENTGTNSSGFGALPGGLRNYNGTYYYIGNEGVYWSSNAYDATFAWEQDLYYYHTQTSLNYGDKVDGFSVRCIKDY